MGIIFFGLKFHSLNLSIWLCFESFLPHHSHHHKVTSSDGTATCILVHRSHSNVDIHIDQYTRSNTWTNHSSFNCVVLQWRSIVLVKLNVIVWQLTIWRFKFRSIIALGNFYENSNFSCVFHHHHHHFSFIYFHNIWLIFRKRRFGFILFFLFWRELKTCRRDLPNVALVLSSSERVYVCVCMEFYRYNWANVDLNACTSETFHSPRHHHLL